MRQLELIFLKVEVSVEVELFKHGSHVSHTDFVGHL